MWSIRVDAPSGWGIEQIGWKYSTQSVYTYVPAAYFCVLEDEIPDNVSVNLVAVLSTGYITASWQIDRDGAQSTITGSSATIQSGGASSVLVFVTGVEAPQTYSCTALIGFGQFQSVSVSPSSVQSGGYATFRAVPAEGYVFAGWSNRPVPTESSIESFDAEYRKQIFADTTLYAMAAVPPEGLATIYTENGWKFYKPTIYIGNGQWKDYEATIKGTGGWPNENGN